MKIGILTCRPMNNYGGILQAYALETVLRRMGHEAGIIDRRTRRWRYLGAMLKLYVKKYCGNPRVVPFYQSPKLRLYTDRFMNAHMTFITAPVSSKRGLKRLNRAGFDAICVGSDQIWRPPYDRNFRDYFLDFLADGNPCLRIAYAASFGTSQWEFSRRQTRQCAALLRKFDAVSVREDSGVRLCADYLDCRRARHVLDPALMLSAPDYTALLGSGEPSSRKGRIFNYILDWNPDKRQAIAEVAEFTGLAPFCLDIAEMDSEVPLPWWVTPPVERWLEGFRDASFVVTDSFHGCVFAILFHRPFIVFGNRSRGMARFESLLGMLGLEDRFVVAGTAPVGEMVKKAIDWAAVDRILDDRRRDSLQFLTDALSHAKV